jgi:hypothetical protein
VDIAHVAKLVEVRESRCEWSVHSVLFGERINDRCVWLHAVQTVQPHQWRTITGAEDYLSSATG